jgi:hypothetical protein
MFVRQAQIRRSIDFTSIADVANKKELTNIEKCFVAFAKTKAILIAVRR